MSKRLLLIIFIIFAIVPIIITCTTGRHGCYGYEINNNCLGLATESRYADHYNWCKAGVKIGKSCFGYNSYSIGTSCVGLTIGDICLGDLEPMPYTPIVRQ